MRWERQLKERLEPRLQDLLDEPITRLLMARDKVEARDVEALLARIRRSRSGEGYGKPH
jgi:hypothetical protein